MNESSRGRCTQRQARKDLHTKFRDSQLVTRPEVCGAAPVAVPAQSGVAWKLRKVSARVGKIRCGIDKEQNLQCQLIGCNVNYCRGRPQACLANNACSCCPLQRIRVGQLTHSESQAQHCDIIS